MNWGSIVISLSQPERVSEGEPGFQGFIMLTHPELQRILEAQPYLRMRHFAEMLGWRGLQMFKCQDERIPGGLLMYYTTSDQKFNLQINARERLSTTLFQACVVAERYRIVHTDWHRFELFTDDN